MVKSLIVFEIPHWLLKKEFKEKLTRTNNYSEKYFHKTSSKLEKMICGGARNIKYNLQQKKWQDIKIKFH